MAADKPPANITLHWLEVSRSHRILWLLEELEIPYELKTYKRCPDGRADSALREIHPLGKSPVVTVEAAGADRPLVLAESAAIVEYLCDYFGKWLIPERYPPGKEGQIGHETESWVRHRYYMHYTEGSLAPLMVISLLASRPAISGTDNKVRELFLKPNFDTHYKFLENQLETSPGGGSFLCGEDLTAADILISFALEAGQTRSGKSETDCPKMWAYMEKLHQREAYQRSVQKIEAIEGSFKTHL